MTRNRSVVTLIITLLALLGTAPSSAGAQTEAALSGATSVDTGDLHTCARLGSGQVRCWGENLDGQLGNDSNTDSDAPVTVLNLAGGGPLTGVTAITVGDDHTCARLGNGQARCWGDNDNGQLGNNSIVDSDLPVVVLNSAGTAPLTGVTALSGGEDHTCARLNTGQLRCWGGNEAGQLGDNSLTDRDTPVVVRSTNGTGALGQVVGVSTGEGHTCAVLSTGQARCWGLNNIGQLGDDSIVNRDVPRVVVGTNGAGTLTGVVAITATASDHTCARLNTGQARCWGDNDFGQLGRNNELDSRVPRVVLNPGNTGPLTGVLQIEVGSNATCARVAGNQARCWGDNDDGENGTGEVGGDHRLPEIVRNPVDTAPLKNVTQITAGDSHACARLANAQIRCWGDSTTGQLGNNDLADSALPVVVHLS